MGNTTNLNIRTDKEIKEKAEEIFKELCLNMSTAINMFLRVSIRENGIPFDLKLEIPNDETIAAIEEDKRLLNDPNTKSFKTVEELFEDLKN